MRVRRQPPGRAIGLERVDLGDGLGQPAEHHSRRKLFDVHAATGSAIAKEALERIAGLFKIEAEINGHGPEQRHAARQERALPQLVALKEFLDEALDRISRKSGLAAAIRYGLSRWQALCRFAHDGRLEMTNNAAERAIRPLALGRKNYMFAGSDAGGERAAAAYTLIETGKLHGLDPEAYLREVLRRIADHSAGTEVRELDATRILRCSTVS